MWTRNGDNCHNSLVYVMVYFYQIMILSISKFWILSELSNGFVLVLHLVIQKLNAGILV